jgi:hypothetical protein
MKLYTYSTARQRLAEVLEEASREGEVQIRRQDGRVYAVTRREAGTVALRQHHGAARQGCDVQGSAPGGTRGRMGTWRPRAAQRPCVAHRVARGARVDPRRLNIRLSSKNLEAIQKRARGEGLPYQTLISNLLHKYACRRLKEL